MTEDEQIAICKQLAVISMWGHGWVGSTVTEHLDQHGPVGPRPWQDVYAENRKVAQRASVGVETDESMLIWYLDRGYTLCNWDTDGCALFNPSSIGGGLYKYVSKELADKYKWRDVTTTRTAEPLSPVMAAVINSILNGEHRGP